MADADIGWPARAESPGAVTSAAKLLREGGVLSAAEGEDVAARVARRVGADGVLLPPAVLSGVSFSVPKAHVTAVVARQPASSRLGLCCWPCTLNAAGQSRVTLSPR